jgi:Arc/MetJ family transcription regulator
MRMTLTIDDDIAAEITRLRRQKDSSLKEVVNDTLRRGLRVAETPTARKPFRMKTYDLGEALVNIDNVAEALAAIEGEDFK